MATTIGSLGERGIIRLIHGALRHDERLISSVDDDAAIFRFGGRTMAVTSDMGLMSTHFTTFDPEKIGKKIVTSNATDLLAKGAIPKYMLTCFGWPRSLKTDFIRKLYKSMDRELARYGAYIIGGDTNVSREFVYSVTLLGEIAGKPLVRGGARAGDYIVLTGEIGSAAAGYLAAKKKLKPVEPEFERAQTEPEIDFRLCKQIMKRAHAGIDSSDGLAFELGEVARLSRKKITLYWDMLPLNPKLAPFCRKHKLDVERVALHMGEDYQIAYSTKHPSEGIIVGKVERGEGVYLVKDSRTRKLDTYGYEHFVSN